MLRLTQLAAADFVHRGAWFLLVGLVVSSAWPQQSPVPPGPPQLIWRSVDLGTLAPDLSDPTQAPKPPFRFVEEDDGGTNPKVKVSDAEGRLWIVKWSEEIHSETFSSRLAAAVGYFIRPAFYVPRGKIEGVEDLGRADPYVESDGSFRNAAFKLISDEAPYLAGHNWAWIDNPFLGTASGRRELNGLKILIMLTSNWDTKDNRDADQGVNTAIYRTTGKGRTVQFLYAMDDWGATMGRWGDFFARDKWDCEGYAAQTPDFVTGVEDGVVKWGYTGKNTKDMTEGITVEDVRWFLESFSRITDEQIESALRSSGAREDEVHCFAPAIRNRIQQLEEVVDRASEGRIGAGGRFSLRRDRGVHK